MLLRRRRTTCEWNEDGSKQFDHALSGLADSDPLHWNERRTKGEVSGRFGHVKKTLAGDSPFMRSVSLQTWHLQEVLDEADVVLCLCRQLLEAPSRLGAAAPAGQRLVVHRHPRQNIHVGCNTGRSITLSDTGDAFVLVQLMIHQKTMVKTTCWKNTCMSGPYTCKDDINLEFPHKPRGRRVV